MNFDYTDEQKFLKGEARKFLEAHCTSAITRSVLDNDHVSFDRGLWKAIAEMGWTGAAIPEEFGGTGLGHIELCALAEELGRVIAPIPFSSTVYVFAEAIMQAGSTAQRQALLPRIASGAVIGCLAVSEGPGPLRPSVVDASVKASKLSGAKIPVTDGDIATHAIVLARAHRGLSLYVVDLTDKGVSRQKMKSLDPTRSVAELRFDEAACELLGPAGKGEDILSVILDRAAVLFAFEQVGGTDKCLEMAKDYAMQRYAFGRLIASYQAIKHKLADIYVKSQIARSCAYYGAWALSTSAHELPEAAAAARIAGSDAYDFAARENHQTHGGMGFTWEVDCHLHLRRARQLALALGGPPIWEERLVRCLERRSAA